MDETVEISRVTIRMPKMVKDWICKEAARKGISQNSEIILALHEKMEASKNEAPENK